MNKFGGSCFYIDRNDINTDEIIPAKYLTENSKLALKPYMLEDLHLEGFDPASPELHSAQVIVTRHNFGCGSSREHAVWVFEVNGIKAVIASSFARIFRQNMFNCGMLAVELPESDIEMLMKLKPASLDIDLDQKTITSKDSDSIQISFELNQFDRDLVEAGGWLAYADQKY